MVQWRKQKTANAGNQHTQTASLHRLLETLLMRNKAKCMYEEYLHAPLKSKQNLLSIIGRNSSGNKNKYWELEIQVSPIRQRSKQTMMLVYTHDVNN